MAGRSLLMSPTTIRMAVVIPTSRNRQRQVDVRHTAGVVEKLGEEGTRAEQPDQAVRHGDPDRRRRRTSSPGPRAGTAAGSRGARAPSALRTPISRVRSCTLTNMMFMMPTPPIASVSTPMNVSTIFSPPTMPPVISLRLRRAEHVERALVGRVVAVALREELAHLLRRLRLEHRRHRLPDERADVRCCPPARPSSSRG